MRVFLDRVQGNIEPRGTEIIEYPKFSVSWIFKRDLNFVLEHSHRFFRTVQQRFRVL